MKKLQKILLSRSINLRIIILLSIIVYGFHRLNNHYDCLTSKNKVISVANVYGKYNMRGVNYFNYIYKVKNDYYSGSLSGENVNDLSNNPIQSFLVVYYKKDPSIHIVIWEKKLETIHSLDSITSFNIFNIESLVYKNVFGPWIAPISDKNDYREINPYLSIFKKELEKEI
jgi:hypothetical protein